MESWHPDPTGRHGERLAVDGAWTATVRDRGVVNQDPVAGLTAGATGPRATPSPAVGPPAGWTVPPHHTVAPGAPVASPAPLPSAPRPSSGSFTSGSPVAPEVPMVPLAPASVPAGATATTPKTRRDERSTGDKILDGASFMVRLVVSALWAAGGAVAVSAGEWGAAGVVAVYLAYLWVFNGRWLVY